MLCACCFLISCLCKRRRRRTVRRPSRREPKFTSPGFESRARVEHALDTTREFTPGGDDSRGVDGVTLTRQSSTMRPRSYSNLDEDAIDQARRGGGARGSLISLRFLGLGCRNGSVQRGSQPPPPTQRAMYDDESGGISLAPISCSISSEMPISSAPPSSMPAPIAAPSSRPPPPSQSAGSEWETAYTPEGDVYYWNRVSGVTTWDLPRAHV